MPCTVTKEDFAADPRHFSRMSLLHFLSIALQWFNDPDMLVALVSNIMSFMPASQMLVSWTAWEVDTSAILPLLGEEGDPEAQYD